MAKTEQAKEGEIKLTDLVSVNPKQLQEFQGWEDKLRKVAKDNPFVEIVDTKTYELAKKRRTALKTGRTSTEKQDKTLGSLISGFRKTLSGLKDELINIVKPSEEKQQEEIDRWEKQKEKEKIAKQKEEEARVKRIEDKIEEISSCFSDLILNLTFENISDSDIKVGMLKEDASNFDFEEFDPVFENQFEKDLKSYELAEQKVIDQHKKYVELEKLRKEKEEREAKEAQEKQRLEKEKKLNEQRSRLESKKNELISLISDSDFNSEDSVIEEVKKAQDAVSKMVDSPIKSEALQSMVFVKQFLESKQINWKHERQEFEKNQVLKEKTIEPLKDSKTEGSEGFNEFISQNDTVSGQSKEGSFLSDEGKEITVNDAEVVEPIIDSEKGQEIIQNDIDTDLYDRFWNEIQLISNKLDAVNSEYLSQVSKQINIDSFKNACISLEEFKTDLENFIGLE